MFIRGVPIILMLAATLAGGQDSNGALPTFGELLKRHSIQLTEPALVDALKNADPEVRDLAAQKLAEDKAEEAIPAIAGALASEKVPSTRMSIAFALAQLGDPVGFDALEENCGDRELEAGVRSRSAEYLLRFGRESTVCLSALLHLLRAGSDGYRAQAASLLPKFHNLSAEDSEKVFAGLVRALHASDASVRMAAGRSLADLKDVRAIRELRDDAANEREQAVRLQIEEDMRMLQEKPR